MTHVIEQRVKRTCEAIGGPLLARLTLVGGARQALLPLKVGVRSTRDVDFIVEAPSTMDWYRFVGELEGVGFRSSKEDGAPLCRYEKVDGGGLLIVDVVPTTDSLGFSNRWYEQAHRHRVRLDSIPHLHVASPLHHLLTKIEAFMGRGAADPIASHDLEDIIAVLVSLDDLIDEIDSGTSEACGAARAFLVAFAQRDDVEDLLYAHLDSAAQHHIAGLLKRFRSIVARHAGR